MGFITAFHQRSGTPVAVKRPKKKGVLTNAAKKKGSK